MNQPNDDILEKEISKIEEEIDQTQTAKAAFDEMDSTQLLNILEATIKKDDLNKLTTFMCFLSAYTEEGQFNISFNAPSSTGKSYIPLQISNLFPREDVIKLSYVSPTAFFHEMGIYDKEKQINCVDLSRKILIFLDQPHNDLLARLRPLFSHDEKEITAKITDKGQKNGLRTKTVVIQGYPAVVFCTAGLNIDEQEATRFFLLSPEVTQEKLRQAIYERIKKEAHSDAYKATLDEHEGRSELKARIKAVRDAKIKEIHIPMWEHINNWFALGQSKLKPRHQRDVNRLMSLIKMFTVLNFMHRERIGNDVIACNTDMEQAIKLWEGIAVSQELNIPPYIYNLHHEIIVPCWQDMNGGVSEWKGDLLESKGVTRQQVQQKHYDVYGRMESDAKFRQQILPMLVMSGLIFQASDSVDKRRLLIYPTTVKKQNNSETWGGVNKK